MSAKLLRTHQHLP